MRKTPSSCELRASLYMAQRTGLEPATPGVTGRYSNRLNYRCASVSQEIWWVMTGSNRRPSACKADALPAELITRVALRGGAIYAEALAKSTPCLKFFFQIVFCRCFADARNGCRQPPSGATTINPRAAAGGLSPALSRPVPAPLRRLARPAAPGSPASSAGARTRWAAG
jgi:hypothetical protein